MAIALLPSPFERVLLATDLSGPSRRLISLLSSVCGSVDAQVAVVHVASTFGADGAEGGLASPEVEERLNVLFREGRDSGLSVQTSVRYGDPEVEIAAMVEEMGATMLALGASSGPNLRTVVVGKIAEKVIHRTAVPVLVQPGTAEPARRLQHVLFAMDQSAASARALPVVDALVQHHGVRVTALHVRPVGGPSAEQELAWLQEVNTEAEGGLRAFIRRYSSFSDAYRTVVGRARKPGEALPAAIEQLGVDLLVVCPHGKNALERLIGGSTSRRLLRVAPVPVLVV